MCATLPPLERHHNHWCLLAAAGGVPPSRWIVNFDFNLLDSLVLAAVLAAYAPFLVWCLSPASLCRR